MKRLVLRQKTFFITKHFKFYIMAVIFNASIDVTKIDKTKLINGKKGTWLPVTVTINDELDDFDNQGSITIQQSKEERESKEKKTYLGNGRVAWCNDQISNLSPTGGAKKAPEKQQDDLPF